MPTDASFRFSTYLTFGLACAAMGYAESALLPEVAAFALFAVLGLGVLSFLESRVPLLSIPAANRLGVFIALGIMLWAAFRLAREYETRELAEVGWQVLIVAMCGPLVMVLLVAKGARRDKHAGDYWSLHGIALAGIVLAAAFAEDPVCFALVALYLIAAVWSLALLYLGRARGAVPPIPGGVGPAPRAVAVTAGPAAHRTDLRPAMAWALVALAAAVPLYLLTPRSRADKAEFGKPRIEIGFAAEQMVDLNRTGQLAVNPEPAFEVRAAYPDGTPKTDLNPNQLWRGRTLRAYSGGEWKPSEDPLPQIAPMSSHPRAWSAPDLGPGRFTLSFEVPERLHATFTADPLLWSPDQPPPLAADGADGLRGWLPVGDGTFFWEPTLHPTRSETLKYRQEYRGGRDPGVGTPFRFVERKFEQRLLPMLANPVGRVKEYADGLLRELIRTGELPEGCRHPITLYPRPEFQDAVARRFAAHLATTPTLRYTTDLKRANREVDPVEDFLFHSRGGHCERYATALALMLRSQGIPTALVLGFRGHDPADGGRYVVRQEHAHAWVSALVAVPGAPDPKDPNARLYQWRSLDPTPAGPELDEREADRAWWARASTWIGSRFQEYVTNYTAEQRHKALAAVGSHLTSPGTVLGTAALVGLVLGARTWRRRRGKPIATDSDSGRWFGELVALLRAHGIEPAPGDTPLEFAARAATALGGRRGCAAVAGVPLAWAEAYYLDRYGGAAPSAARRAELDTGLVALRRALRGG
jgi:transglutaminase-like putative cysteine protease